jgi:hypothetical protein
MQFINLYYVCSNYIFSVWLNHIFILNYFPNRNDITTITFNECY